MKIELGYGFRMDGMFLIKKVCIHCKEPYSVLALAGTSPWPLDSLCDACGSAYKAEEIIRELEGGK